MKVAFLFLTQGDLNQATIWQDFFANADPDSFSVYCHPKFPDRIDSPVLRDRIISELIPTEHADISLVRATLLLLRAARSDPENRYLVLLSESCVPLYPFTGIAHALSTWDRSLIAHRVADQESLQRWESLRDRAFVPRENFEKHPQWVCLDRDAVDLFLTKDHTEVFSAMYAPDEHYFISVMAHEGFPIEQRVRDHMMTFSNWREVEREHVPKLMESGETELVLRNRPKTYHVVTHEDREAARRSGCLFFRKVAPDCQLI